MTAPMHRCPGGCGGAVGRSMLACRPCWRRLPPIYRDEVNVGWRARTRDAGRSHRQAVLNALRWYRDNRQG